ncbi:hypothetical protein B5F29_03300 [Lachnoclostridium sp. An196]|nr:hypothetical protein B5F29_03300 [Lachnoclostridium sp. An196]
MLLTGNSIVKDETAWYNERETRIIPPRMPVSAFAAESRAHPPEASCLRSGHDIMSVKRELYHRACRFLRSPQKAGRIRRRHHVCEADMI